MTKQTENSGDKAEGTIDGVPFNTELVSCDGVTIHFWLGANATLERAKELRRISARIRDVVGCTYSSGQPSGFWPSHPLNYDAAGRKIAEGGDK